MDAAHVPTDMPTASAEARELLWAFKSSVITATESVMKLMKRSGKDSQHVNKCEQDMKAFIAALESRVARLTEELATHRQCQQWKQRAEETKAMLDSFTAELAENDTAIRDLCRPFLTEQTCDHDGHAVVPLVDAVGNAIEALRKRAEAAERERDEQIMRGDDLYRQLNAAVALVREVAAASPWITVRGRSICYWCSAPFEGEGKRHEAACLGDKCRAFGKEAESPDPKQPMTWDEIKGLRGGYIKSRRRRGRRE